MRSAWRLAWRVRRGARGWTASPGLRRARSGLSRLLLFTLFTLFPAPSPRAEEICFPPGAGVIDVTKPPYGARGDGRTDDTAALQRALDDHTGRNTILYLPKGTYRITGTLRLPLRNREGRTNWGNTHLQGQSRSGTVLRLQDRTFTDPARPAAVLDSGPHGSADWFHNDVRNLTIDTGRGNPGAIGLRFFSNNTGCVRDVTIRSGDRQGAIGLDLAYNDMNGPLLIQDVQVRGFALGIKTGHTVNSQTFSRIRLQDQTECGFRNDGQFLAIEGLRSAESVPALWNTGGLIALVDARLTGTGGGRGLAAIRNDADLYARGIHTPGYRAIIESASTHGQGAAGPELGEHVSAPAVRLFPGPPHALSLPVREPPSIPWGDPREWVSPVRFGAHPDQEADAAPALQAVIDSGAATVYLPHGAWRIGRTVHLRGKLRRLIGCEATLDPIAPLTGRAEPMFRVDPGSGSVVLERLSAGFQSGPFFFLEDAAARPVALSSVAINFQGAAAYRNRPGAGPLFLEDVVGGDWQFRDQEVWAWQLNVENQGTHILNDGGRLRIIGLKTERGGTLVRTTRGGRTEVLGGLCYTTTAGKLAPMFVNDASAVSVTLGERCYNGDPYTTILREIRDGLTRELPNTDPAYRGRLVLYAGGGAARE